MKALMCNDIAEALEKPENQPGPVERFIDRWLGDT
jgi:hypothetical protein